MNQEQKLVNVLEQLNSLKEKLYFHLHKEGNNINWEQSFVDSRLKQLVLVGTSKYDKFINIKLSFESELDQIDLNSEALIIKKFVCSYDGFFPRKSNMFRTYLNQSDSIFRVIDSIREMFN